MIPDAPELPTLDALTLARAAADEGIDLRTLRRRIRGETVRGLAGARADRAIAKLRASCAGPNHGPLAA